MYLIDLKKERTIYYYKRIKSPEAPSFKESNETFSKDFVIVGSFVYSGIVKINGVDKNRKKTPHAIRNLF